MTPAEAPPRVFLCYRREDSSGHAGRLYDRLADTFGDEQIFMDIDTLVGGDDWVDHIQRAVEQCDILLAVIGTRWLEVVDSEGRPRLDEPTDAVRLEIATALERGIRVIPVLVQEADVPKGEKLPEDLQALVRRHAVEVSDTRWRYDVERLLGTLTRIAESVEEDRLQIAERKVAELREAEERAARERAAEERAAQERALAAKTDEARAAEERAAAERAAAAKAAEARAAEERAAEERAAAARAAEARAAEEKAAEERASAAKAAEARAAEERAAAERAAAKAAKEKADAERAAARAAKEKAEAEAAAAAAARDKAADERAAADRAAEAKAEEERAAEQRARARAAEEKAAEERAAAAKAAEAKAAKQKATEERRAARAAKARAAEERTAAGARHAAPETAEPARRPNPLIFAAVGVAVLAIAGFLIGSSGGGDEGPPADFPRSAAIGPVNVSFPSDWSRAPAAKPIPGLPLGQPLAVKPERAPGSLVAGMTSATGATLLPAEFVKRLGREPRPTDRVELGNVEAIRYRGLRVKGMRGPVTLYAVPTTGGVATLACQLPPANPGRFPADCERVAATLELLGAKAYDLGPDEAFAKKLSSALGRLDRARAGGLAALRRARTNLAQGDAAGRVSRAYSAAARAVAAAKVTPESAALKAALVRALRRNRNSYRSLGRAASINRRNNYNGARRAIRRTEAVLAAALKDLRAAGYR